MSDLMMSGFMPVRPASVSGAPLDVVLRTYLTRRQLPGLTARELADIGVSNLEAAAEAARLPWDTAARPRSSGRGIIAALHRALERARMRRLISRLTAQDGVR